MRRVDLRINCDICEQDDDEIETGYRTIVVGQDGKVRTLDLCFVHDGNIRPSQLERYAREYGTLMRPVVTRGDKIRVVPRENQRASGSNSSRAVFHEPAGAWGGEYHGPATCLVAVGPGKQCGETLKNVVGLKVHQSAAHGIKVRR